MRLIHLPTLDGSPEAAVARLEAIGQQDRLSEIEDGIWQAGNIFDELHGVVAEGHNREAKSTASHLRSEHEAVLTNVQHEIDRLVAS